jgi:hypothetical protein
MPGPARRSRVVAVGLSVGTLLGLVTGMILTEHPASPPQSAVTTAPDPFTTGRPATPASSPPAGPAGFRQTITSAS